MNVTQLVTKLQERRTTLVSQMDEMVKTAADETRDFNETEDTKWKECRGEIDRLDERISELLDAEEREKKAAEAARRIDPEAAPKIAVGNEEVTYRKNGPHSYFRDLVFKRVRNDEQATERLARHAEEVRANMTRTDGAGGEFVPPLWLLNEYVALARAGRVTADLCRKLPLPPGTDSINLPKVSTGTAAAEQSDGSAVQKTDMTTTSVSGAVTTMAGQQVFALQLLEQSPVNFDQVVFQDLLADLAKQVDIYVINKASIGILNVSSIVSVTYTDASPTVPELFPKLADATQQIATGRFLPQQAWVMHPRRWGWILAALDSSSRPLVVPNAQGPTNAFAGLADVRAEGSVGSLQGLPVYVDPNVPTTLGGGTEDAIIGARFDDLFLYEGDPRTRVLFETDANTLEVRLQVWEYMAFIGSRYPKAIGKITGTGLAAPTF